MSETGSSGSEEGSGSDSESDLQLELKKLKLEQKIIDAQLHLKRKRSCEMASDDEVVEPPKQKKKHKKSPPPIDTSSDDDGSNIPIPIPKYAKKTKKKEKQEKQTSREFYYKRDVLKKPKGMITERPKTAKFHAYTTSLWCLRNDEDGWNRFREYIRRTVNDRLDTRVLWNKQKARHDKFIGIVEADYPVLRFQRGHFTINYAASSYLRHCIKTRAKKKAAKSSARALSPPALSASSTTPAASASYANTPTPADSPDDVAVSQLPGASTGTFYDTEDGPYGSSYDMQQQTQTLPIYSMGGEIYPIPEMDIAPVVQPAVTNSTAPTHSPAPQTVTAPASKPIPTNRVRRLMVYKDPDPASETSFPIPNSAPMATTSQPSHMSPTASTSSSLSDTSTPTRPAIRTKPTAGVGPANKMTAPKKKVLVATASTAIRKSSRKKK